MTITGVCAGEVSVVALTSVVVVVVVVVFSSWAWYGVAVGSSGGAGGVWAFARRGQSKTRDRAFPRTSQPYVT